MSKRKIPSIKLSIQFNNSSYDTRIFDSEVITIGRSSNCDLSLPEDTISNHHARLTFHHMQWWIEDLKSKNGTLINAQKLSTSTVITTGDQISIGNYLIQISKVSDISLSENENIHPEDESYE